MECRTKIFTQYVKANLPMENLSAWIRLDNMPAPESNYASIPCSAGTFATTHWSVVQAAGEANTPQAALALEKLCRTYWRPLYLFVRRNGHAAHDAEDLIQDFFARLLERRDLETIRREKGRFRSFLLVSLKHYLINEGLRSRTQKRGGGRLLIPLDDLMSRERPELEPAEASTPESIFEKRWAMTLLDQVLAQLRDEFRENGKLPHFEALKCFLLESQNSRPQLEIADELGTSVGTVKQWVRRLRVRYRELLRQEVAQTVATAGDVEDELRYLIRALRS
jgi:RNA polymerase sigma factor (sigma-70 family)